MGVVNQHDDNPYWSGQYNAKISLSRRTHSSWSSCTCKHSKGLLPFLRKKCWLVKCIIHNDDTSFFECNSGSASNTTSSCSHQRLFILSQRSKISNAKRKGTPFYVFKETWVSLVLVLSPHNILLSGKRVDLDLFFGPRDREVIVSLLSIIWGILLPTFCITSYQNAIPLFIVFIQKTMVIQELIAFLALSHCLSLRTILGDCIEVDMRPSIC